MEMKSDALIIFNQFYATETKIVFNKLI